MAKTVDVKAKGEDTTLQELTDYLAKLMEQGFYGEVVLKFRQGRLVLAEQRQTIQLKDRSE